MSYRKVTLMPPQGLVLERAAVLCGIIESSNHEREDILCLFRDKIFFFLPDFPNWTCSSMPHSGMPRVCQTPSWHFVGAARESNFTSVHEELLIGGSGDHTDNGVSSEFIME